MILHVWSIIGPIGFIMIGCCASVLEEFAKSERAKNRSLSVTYCIAGRLADDDSKVTSLLVLEQRHIIATWHMCTLWSIQW